MRYSYEYKRKCVELYREGEWPETPAGIKTCNFRSTIAIWYRMEEAQGPESLKHKNANKVWKPEEKLELVSQVIAGKSNKSVAIDAGIDHGLLRKWVRKYKTEGYNGLANMKLGRPSRDNTMKKKNEDQGSLR